MRSNLFRKGFRLALGGALTAVMVATNAFGALGTSEVHAAGSMTDPIMVASFWTDYTDTTDTVYFSTDGWNFHEICEAFTDQSPSTDDSRITAQHHNYVWSGYRVLQWDSANQSYVYDGDGWYSDYTLHDPSIVWYNGAFWMASGYTAGTGEDRRVIIMLAYSKDLIHWSYPGSGSQTNIKLSELPHVTERATHYNSDEWDMVAPEIFVDSNGRLYVTFCVGYFAIFHGDSEQYDEMYPYIAEITDITLPEFADSRDPSRQYTPDPALMPEVADFMEVTYTDATPMNLPCIDSNTATRLYGGHNHIDGSFYEEGGYYYFSIKENGVTDEIWRINDLSRVGDPNAWELVSYDVITGYEGPCLTKYGGQYFMYVDRLATFTETDLDGNMASTNFGTPGIHVIKSSTATTGKLDGYTGWLEDNIKEINTYKLNPRTEKKGCRHGTVITVEGEAARIVREAAISVGYDESELYGTYNASDWTHTGWYHKESFLAPNLYGELGTQFHKYYYENDVRIGTSLNSDIGALRTLNDNPYYFQPNAGDPERDGMMLCGYRGAWTLGYPMVTVPVDWDYYNEVGSAAYGTAKSSWVTYMYGEHGEVVKGSGVPGITLRGGTDDWYRFDSETGRMVKGAYGYVNDAGYKIFMWFDTDSGKQLRGTYGTGETFVNSGGSLDGFAVLNVNRRNYYVDMYGTVCYLKYEYSNGNAYGPYLVGVDEKGQLPEVDYHSPRQDVYSEEGHPASGWYKPNGEDGLWYWYENNTRQGTSTDETGVYGIDRATQTAINRGREIVGPDKNGVNQWFWLDSDRQGARAVGKEVWIPYIDQKEGEWTAEQMREYANNADEGMRDFVYQCMIEGIGKWVRYDENGSMLKGWVTIEGALADVYPNQRGNVYYYDHLTGLMAKGDITIDGVTYHFDEITGVRQ